MHPFYKRGKALAHKPSRTFELSYIPPLCSVELPNISSGGQGSHLVKPAACLYQSKRNSSGQQPEEAQKADTTDPSNLWVLKSKTAWLPSLFHQAPQKQLEDPRISRKDDALSLNLDEILKDFVLLDELNCSLNDSKLYSIQADLIKNQGHHNYLLALTLLQSENGNDLKVLREVLQLFKDAAHVGHIEAALNAGMMHDPRSSKCIDIDMSTAIFYYKSAANDGNYTAQFKLGMLMLHQIQGTRPIVQFEKAIEWIQKAAAQKCSQALNVLQLIQ